MNWINRVKLLKNRLFDPAVKRSVVIEALIAEETVKTILVNYKDQTVWLQKSLVMFNQHEKNKATITIPFWLFARKFPKLTNKSVKNSK